MHPTPHNPSSAGVRFLNAVRPYREMGDETRLRRVIASEWSISDMIGFLNSDDLEICVASAFCLGLLGNHVACLALAGALRRDESAVVSAAEDALWRLWFDAAGQAGRRKLRRAMDLTEEGRLAGASEVLDDLIRLEPSFAEAYHQRAIVGHMDNRITRAIADYRRALELAPCHFGAWAGLGKALADVNEFHGAIETYRKALSIHPRMEGIRQAIRNIRSILSDERTLLCDD